MMLRVVYLVRTPAEHREILLSEEPPGFGSLWLETDDPAEARAKLAEADFAVAVRMSAEEIAWAPRLRLIQMPGVGYERIDVAAAAARGIPVAITPEGTCVGVAEHTALLILALAKHLMEAHGALKEGRWIHAQLRPVCMMLEGKRVGIVGMGRIGREVAKRLAPFGVELVYSDLRPLPPDQEAATGAAYVPLEELLRTSDVVTLHVFLAEGSRHLIGARELALMKPSAVLINTSRGGVIDEAALLPALREGRIAAAGLDVFETEPLPPGHPLLELDNVLLTPHMATANRDAMIQKSRACYANFQRVLRGELPINVVKAYS